MQIAEGGREVAVHDNVFNFNFPNFFLGGRGEICFLDTIPLLQGGPKKQGHYVWLQSSPLHIAWTNVHDFGTLHRRFVLNMSVNSNLIKCIALWCHNGESQQPRVCFRRLVQVIQHKMLSRTSLDRLLNKTVSCSVLNDGKIEAVHCQFEQQQTLCKLETWYAVNVAESLAGVGHQWMVSSSQMHYAAERRTCEMKAWCLCSQFFHNVCTEVRK